MSLVFLLLHAGEALAANDYGDHSKITVCHKTGDGEQTKDIAVSSLDGHLGHGDYLGPCAPVIDPPPADEDGDDGDDPPPPPPPVEDDDDNGDDPPPPPPVDEDDGDEGEGGDQGDDPGDDPLDPPAPVDDEDESGSDEGDPPLAPPVVPDAAPGEARLLLCMPTPVLRSDGSLGLAADVPVSALGVGVWATGVIARYYEGVGASCDFGLGGTRTGELHDGYPVYANWRL